MMPPVVCATSRELRLALGRELRRQRLAVVVVADADDSCRRRPPRGSARACGRRSARRRSACPPRAHFAATLTGSPSRSSPSVTSTMMRTWSFDFGSRAKSSRARSSARASPCRRRACRSDRAGGRTARSRAPSLVSGKLIGSPANATAREARARQLLDEARRPRPWRGDAARLDVARVHALRVVEHDHHVEVGRRDEPRALAVLRPRERDERERAVASTSSTPFHARRFVASEVTSARTTLGIAEARHRARAARATTEHQDRPRTRAARTPARSDEVRTGSRGDRTRTLTGTSASSHARRSASSATSSTAGDEQEREEILRRRRLRPRSVVFSRLVEHGVHAARRAPCRRSR